MSIANGKVIIYKYSRWYFTVFLGCSDPYSYKDAFVVLMPKHKMIFINFGDEDDFEEFQEDFIEDMGYISKKYDFIVGRPRKWQKEFVTEIQYSSEDFSFKEILRKNELTDKELIRRGDIEFVNRKGFLKVEEPSDDEKRNLANAIINRGNLHKSLFQKAEEIMDEMGVVDKEHRDMIHQLIRVRFKNKENDENKLRKFIQANSGALE